MPTKDSKQVTFRWDDEARELVLITAHEELRLSGDRAKQLFDLLYRHRHQLGSTAPALPEWAMPDNASSSPTIKLLRPAVGDKVVVRARLHGTHKGALMGVAPSGKQVRVPLIIIYRLASGKIAQHWMQADMLGLLQQIGALPASERAS